MTGFSPEELQLAARNSGMPLEAMRWDVTPVGLHYLLIHYDVPLVEPSGWRLSIGGAVSAPCELSLDDLRGRAVETRAVTMECAGNGRARLAPRPVSQPWLHEAVGTGEWTGTPLAGVLEDAGISSGAVDVVFTGLDRGVEGSEEQHYARALSVTDALRDEVLLAWGLNGMPLPPQHGFPLRLIVPGWYGMTSVKWLSRIDVIDRAFDGYQQREAYRMRATEDDPGVPVTRMAPRALMVPPGIPEFMSRRRHLPAGPVELFGRAWSGNGTIADVEVSVDGGASWAWASLEPEAGPFAWRGWRFAWNAVPGEFELCCRCSDSSGARQPVEAAWNVGGYANTSVQRVAVTVTEGPLTR